MGKIQSIRALQKEQTNEMQVNNNINSNTSSSSGGSTVIKTNIRALNIHRNLIKVNNRLSLSSARLTSGKRINSSTDDAAGLAISEKMNSQIRGFDQASRNSQDARALTSVADGGLKQMNEISLRMRELLIQANSSTNAKEDRELIQDELTQLVDEFDAIINQVQYNGDLLLDGSKKELTIQVGTEPAQFVTFDINEVSSQTLGLDKLNVTNGSEIVPAQLEIIDNAINKVSYERAKLGVISNRLDYSKNIAEISSFDLQDSKSRVVDTNMAEEMMIYTKSNVLQQSGMLLLTQANQSATSVLSLLNDPEEEIIIE